MGNEVAASCSSLENGETAMPGGHNGSHTENSELAWEGVASRAERGDDAPA